MLLPESCRNLISFEATFLLARKALIIDCTLTIFFTCVSYNLKKKLNVKLHCYSYVNNKMEHKTWGNSIILSKKKLLI